MTSAEITLLNSSTAYKSVARYNCLDGYWMRPNVYQYHVMCTATGHWSNIFMSKCTGMYSDESAASVCQIYTGMHEYAYE